MNGGGIRLAALWMGSAALVACASSPPPRPAEFDPANPSAREAAPLAVSRLTEPGSQQHETKEYDSDNVPDANTSKEAELAPPASGHDHDAATNEDSRTEKTRNKTAPARELKSRGPVSPKRRDGAR